MTIKKIFGFITALTFSAQVMAFEQSESLPFDSIVCKAGNKSVQVEIKYYRQTYGAGPAFIETRGANWIGEWKWQAADEGTRLSGYYHLNIKANGQNGTRAFSLHTLYDPLYGKLSGGWLEMEASSGSVNCKVLF